MSCYTLPESVEIRGQDYEIRTDFRVILDILEALSDPNLSTAEQALAAFIIFYPQFNAIPKNGYQQAIEQCYWFIDGGEEIKLRPRNLRLMDWAQDFPNIIAPVNRVLGFECRSVKYNAKENTGGVHWWTFLSGFKEIGECYFAQIVNIRSKRARGKTLTKSEKEFERQNRAAITLKSTYSDEEKEFFKKVLGK